MKKTEEGKITIQGEIFPNRKGKTILEKLMKMFNACKRYAYKRLLENEERKSLKKILQPIFQLNSRYVDDAILKAQETIESCEQLGTNPKKVIWGTKKLYQEMREAKKKQNEKKYNKLKQQWQDKRNGSVYSRGDSAKEGNLNLRIEYKKKRKFMIRVNIGFRKWIYIPLFLGKKYAKKMIEELQKAKPNYTVELLLREGRYFANITLEKPKLERKHKYDHGAIGVDLNAFPAHIAWAEINYDGNVLDAGKISTERLFDARANQREWWRGEYAKELVLLAKEKGKGIIIENLEHLPRTKDKVKSKKLRRIFSNFSYLALKEAILSQAYKHQVAVFPVWPGYTSIIGKLKYAQNYSLSSHQAAAMVIARRGFGFQEHLTVELFTLANSLDLINTGEVKSLVGRNLANPSPKVLEEASRGWSVWRGLAEAVLTGRSSKTPLRKGGRCPT